jgi:hypothetical protein
MRQTKQRRRGSTTVIPMQHCPACLAPLNRATAAEGKRGPRAGDLNVCIKCAAVSMYDDTLKLRSVNDTEMAALAVVDPNAWQRIKDYRRIILTLPAPQSHDTKTRH